MDRSDWELECQLSRASFHRLIGLFTFAPHRLLISEPSGCESLKLSESTHIVGEIGESNLDFRACLADGSQDRLVHRSDLMSEHMFHPRPDPRSTFIVALLGRRQCLFAPGALMDMIDDAASPEVAGRVL